MELTRVTGSRGEQGAKLTAAGGDADLLALLLGGDQEPSSAFPATLEAALASGEAEDPIAIGAGEGDEAATVGPDDGAAVSVDAALAAALALASATAASAATGALEAVGGEIAPGTEIDLTGTAGDAAADAIDVVSAAAAATTDARVFAVAADAQADSDAKDAAAAAAEAAAVAREGVAPAPTGADAPSPPTSASTTATLGAATVPTDASGSADPATNAAPRALAPVGDHGGAVREQHAKTPPEHGAGAGVGAEEAPSFAHEEGEQHGLDLGTAERHLAFPTVEAPGQTPTTAANAGAPGDTVHVGRAESGADRAAQVTASTAPPVAAPEATAVRGERPVHHPGAIEARWGERVSDAVRLSALRGGGEIRLQLEPEGLGHIDVRLHLQSDGVRAVIVAEHESTRALLTSQQHVLQDAFDRSDLRLSGFSVDVGSDGRAASFAGADDGGRDAGPGSGSPGAAPQTTTSVATSEVAAEPAADGRVNVRV